MRNTHFLTKKPAIFALAVLFLLSAGLTSLSALQITTLAHGGNLSFDKSSETSEDGLSGTDFFYGFSLYGEQPVDENLTLKAGLKYDPILRYTAYTTFQYSRDFYTIAVGPFFGILNSWNPLMKSGISTSVRLDFPGIAYLSFRSDSSIAARFTKAGDYLQENNSIEAGYYIPFAICSVSLNSKRYVSQQTASLEVDDSFTEYAYNIDIFQKNVPVRVMLSFAYQQLERNYSTTISNSLNSLILGTRFRIELSPTVTLLARMDSNVYSFGKKNDSTALSLPDSGLKQFIFRAELGAELNF